MNGMQGHALGDAEFHREKFSPEAHGEKVVEEFNLRRLQNLTVELEHWKHNHATEVRRARILKDRTDMPIERVNAYNLWGDDLRELAQTRELLRNQAEYIRTLQDENLRLLKNSDAKSLFIADQESTLGKVLELQKDKEALIATLLTTQAELVEAWDSACAFVDSHAADPDITAEMIDTYSKFQNHREALKRWGNE